MTWRTTHPRNVGHVWRGFGTTVARGTSQLEVLGDIAGGASHVQSISRLLKHSGPSLDVTLSLLTFLYR